MQALKSERAIHKANGRRARASSRQNQEAGARDSHTWGKKEMQRFKTKRRFIKAFPTIKICKTCFKRRGIWRTSKGKAICRPCAKSLKGEARIKLPHFYGMH